VDVAGAIAQARKGTGRKMGSAHGLVGATHPAFVKLEAAAL
jgi:hypothetical protein